MLLLIWTDLIRSQFQGTLLRLCSYIIRFLIIRYVLFMISFCLGQEFWIFARLFDLNVTIKDTFFPIISINKNKKGLSYLKIFLMFIIFMLVVYVYLIARKHIHATQTMDFLIPKNDNQTNHLEGNNTEPILKNTTQDTIPPKVSDPTSQIPLKEDPKPTKDTKPADPSPSTNSKKSSPDQKAPATDPHEEKVQPKEGEQAGMEEKKEQRGSSEEFKEEQNNPPTPHKAETPTKPPPTPSKSNPKRSQKSKPSKNKVKPNKETLNKLSSLKQKSTRKKS
uniref:Uncharacterized protein n=1 Tax=Euplotes crassus TaxID=5936 RepID=A0A7S3NW46_EUPCR|mmetsp:Transcript_26051/g.25890  ORF Transcript_26051/g.25890 Transcript_26051/m.25890 type:complete len:279 (+) Transcript_26051:492-1328(+)